MYIPKRYGSYKIDSCPFCGKQSVTKNSQGVPVCIAHKKEELKDLKCVCGSWLDVKEGKYGAYFSCIKCGNVNFRKVLEMNPVQRKSADEDKKEQSKECSEKKPVFRREITENSKPSKFRQSLPRKEITIKSTDIY
jgi:hypothetical protein